MPAKAATAKAVQLAKLAVFWDDEADNELIRLFPYDNNPDRFRGDREDLSAIRSSMKKYEETEAGIGEDKAFYDARFELQFVDTGD